MFFFFWSIDLISQLLLSNFVFLYIRVYGLLNKIMFLDFFCKLLSCFITFRSVHRMDRQVPTEQIQQIT